MTLALAPYGANARPSSSPTWLAAAAIALALHGALVLAAVWTYSAEVSDDDAGTPAIELAMDMAAPKTEASDLPPGPESDASAAAPDAARATPKTEAIERPKEDPLEAENPDRVASPETARKPEQQPDQAKPQPSEASTASIASEATAAPAQEATRDAQVAVAPAIGPGRNAQRERATWQRRLVAHLDRHKRYPAGEGRRDVEVSIRFTIDRLGHIVSAAVLRSSGAPAFDEAALAMMRRSDPVPPPPPLVADEGLTFTAPVVFTAHSRRAADRAFR